MGAGGEVDRLMLQACWDKIPAFAGMTLLRGSLVTRHFSFLSLHASRLML